MTTEYRLFVATKAFIRNKKGEVLIVRESSKYKDAVHVGRFDVVGGRVNPGERFDEGLRREIREETGLEVKIGRPFSVIEWRPEVRGEKCQIVATFFACKAKNKKVVLGDDHDAYEWIDPKEYTKHNLIDILTPAFEAYNDL